MWALFDAPTIRRKLLTREAQRIASNIGKPQLLTRVL
jgi:hypothetical protein